MNKAVLVLIVGLLIFVGYFSYKSTQSPELQKVSETPVSPEMQVYQDLKFLLAKKGKSFCDYIKTAVFYEELAEQETNFQFPSNPMSSKANEFYLNKLDDFNKTLFENHGVNDSIHSLIMGLYYFGDEIPKCN